MPIDPASTPAIANLLLKLAHETFRFLSPSAVQAAGDEFLRKASELLLQHEARLTRKDVDDYASHVQKAKCLESECLDYQNGGRSKRCNIIARTTLSHKYKHRCRITMVTAQRTTTAALTRACVNLKLEEPSSSPSATKLVLQMKTSDGQTHQLVVCVNDNGSVDNVDAAQGGLLIESFKSIRVHSNIPPQSDEEKQMDVAEGAQTSPAEDMEAHPGHISMDSRSDDSDLEFDVASLLEEIDDNGFKPTQAGIFERLINAMASFGPKY